MRLVHEAQGSGGQPETVLQAPTPLKDLLLPVPHMQRQIAFGGGSKGHMRRRRTGKFKVKQDNHLKIRQRRAAQNDTGPRAAGPR